MYQVYQKTKGIDPVLIAVIENNKIISGFLTYTIVEKAMVDFLTKRVIVHGGPLYHSSSKGLLSVELLIRAFDTYFNRKCIFSQIRNVTQQAELQPLLNNQRYKWIDHLNILIDTSQSKEELWKQLTKARRNGITKNKKSGTHIIRVSDVHDAYLLLKKTYKRAKIPLVDSSLFESTQRHLKEKLHIYIMKKEDVPIGTIILLEYYDRLYDWYAGFDENYSKLCPNDALVWHAILTAQQKNLKIFDFGGAGSPQAPYGVRDFKKQFGGSEQNLGRYEKVYAPLRYNFVKKIFEISRIIK